MIASLFLAPFLRANGPCFASPDQFIVTNGTLSVAYGKSMALCIDKGYQYFVFRSFTMTGPDGLTMKIEGPQDLEADLISEMIEEIAPNFPHVKAEFEIYCFRDKPDLAVSAMDVGAFQEIIESFQQLVETVEENNVIEVSSIDELNEYLNGSDLPVFVDFYSEYCPSCQMLAPQYDQLSIDHAEKAIFLKVDIAEAEELCSKYEIQSIPTLLVFEEGNVANTAMGVPSILDLLRNR